MIILEPSIDKEKLHFSIKYSGKVEGLSEMTVWVADTRETLWIVNLNYFRGEEITYGKTPGGFTSESKGFAKQVFPKGIPAKKIPHEKQILVYVSYHYNSVFGPSTTSKFFGFQLSKDRKNVIHFREENYPTGKGPDVDRLGNTYSAE